MGDASARVEQGSHAIEVVPPGTNHLAALPAQDPSAPPRT
jgi:hypothetical protein